MRKTLRDRMIQTFWPEAILGLLVAGFLLGYPALRDRHPKSHCGTEQAPTHIIRCWSSGELVFRQKFWRDGRFACTEDGKTINWWKWNPVEREWYCVEEEL